jgi:hypothetical protein
VNRYPNLVTRERGFAAEVRRHGVKAIPREIGAVRTALMLMYEQIFACKLETVMGDIVGQSMESRPHFGFRRWWLLCLVASIGAAFGCPSLGAQDAPQSVSAEDTPQQSSPQTSPAAGAEHEVSWRTLPGNLLQDQKDNWLFPV